MTFLNYKILCACENLVIQTCMQHKVKGLSPLIQTTLHTNIAYTFLKKIGCTVHIVLQLAIF